MNVGRQVPGPKYRYFQACITHLGCSVTDSTLSSFRHVSAANIELLGAPLFSDVVLDETWWRHSGDLASTVVTDWLYWLTGRPNSPLRVSFSASEVLRFLRCSHLLTAPPEL